MCSLASTSGTWLIHIFSPVVWGCGGGGIRYTTLKQALLAHLRELISGGDHHVDWKTMIRDTDLPSESDQPAPTSVDLKCQNRSKWSHSSHSLAQGWGLRCQESSLACVSHSQKDSNLGFWHYPHMNWLLQPQSQINMVENAHHIA